jgi:ABC-type multidrug transport system permease subunit
MSFFFSALKKDLARWRQDAVAMLLWLAIPLLIGGLIMTLVGGGNGPKPTGLLLIDDQDDSMLSGLVAGAYSQGELGELLIVEKVDAEEGLERIEAGEASGFLTIPEGFQDALLDSQPVTLALKTNPAQTILPGIITDVTEILLDAGFYAEQLLGDEIRKIKEASDSESVDELFVAEISVAIQNKVDSTASILFPPLIEVTVAEPPPEEPGVPFALLYLPGIALMALMFAANGLAGDYWKERETGTLRRLVSSPARLAGFIAGKAAATGIIIMVIGFIVLTLGFLHQGVPFSRMPSSMVWLVLSGIALFAWLGFLQMLAPTLHSAELLTNIALFPLLMIGGSFFPLAALPGWLAALGEKTPNGFMAAQLTTEITASESWSVDTSGWLIVVAIALSGMALSAWRLRAGFARR